MTEQQQAKVRLNNVNQNVAERRLDDVNVSVGRQTWWGQPFISWFACRPAGCLDIYRTELRHETSYVTLVALNQWKIIQTVLSRHSWLINKTIMSKRVSLASRLCFIMVDLCWSSSDDQIPNNKSLAHHCLCQLPLNSILYSLSDSDSYSDLASSQSLSLCYYYDD